MIEPRPEVMNTAVALHGGRRGQVAAAGTDGARLLDFSVCLNAFGTSPDVLEAIRASRVDEYPDVHSYVPREAAAVHWNRPIGEIAFGAGAAEFIHAVCFAYVRAGDDVLIAAPAFGEYARAAALCGARVTFVSPGAPGAGEDSLVDVTRNVLSVRPRLVFCASPVNPTGVQYNDDSLHSHAYECHASGTLLLLDQAYDGFTKTPLGTPALPGHPAVLHLRSLTKEHALAGVRAAFAVGPTEIVEAIERVRIPWAASSAAQAAAAATFSAAATAHAARTIEVLRAEAARIANAAEELGYDVHPSATHYLILNVGDAKRAATALAASPKILVRDCTSFGLPAWIRVASRTPAENDRLIAALAAQRTSLT